MLTLSPVTIIGTIINLLVLYFLLQHFLFKPIQKIMDQRDELIRGQLKDAQDQKESAGKLKAQYEEALASAKEESGQIVDKARKTMEVEREQAMREMKSQIADIALTAASKIMGEKNSSERDLALYDQFLEEAGDSDDTDS